MGVGPGLLPWPPADGGHSQGDGTIRGSGRVCCLWPPANGGHSLTRWYQLGVGPGLLSLARPADWRTISLTRCTSQGVGPGFVVPGRLLMADIRKEMVPVGGRAGFVVPGPTPAC